MMLKLRVGRCWATGGEAQYERGRKTESAMPKDMGTYRAWVRDAVPILRQGHPRVRHRERDQLQELLGRDTSGFATLAETAAKEIRAADRNALVVDAGLSSTTYGYGLSKWLLEQGREADAIGHNRYYERRFGTRGKIVEIRDRAGLEQALTSEQGARNLTYLALMNDLARRKVVDVRQIHFYETYSPSLPCSPTCVPHHTASTPIEAWEVGRFARTVDAETAERDDEMLKTMSLVLAEGATVAIWLPWRSTLPVATRTSHARAARAGRPGARGRSPVPGHARRLTGRPRRRRSTTPASRGSPSRSPAAQRLSCGPTTRSPSTLGPGESASPVGKASEGRSGQVTGRQSRCRP